MVETAAHLADPVIARLPVRQWVLCVPKRLRYHLERDPAAVNAALHIFLAAIERVLWQHSPGDGAASRLGAVVFIHRFGALLNTAQAIADGEHGRGFSVDAAVRIEAFDRDGLKRPLRYCTRPAFSLERLREIDRKYLVYESVKPGPKGGVSLMLTPMQLLNRLAAFIPPPTLKPARGRAGGPDHGGRRRHR